MTGLFIQTFSANGDNVCELISYLSLADVDITDTQYKLKSASKMLSNLCTEAVYLLIFRSTSMFLRLLVNSCSLSH